MERFLFRCAEYIYEKHPQNLHDVCLVFPNRRAGAFFNSYLQKQLLQPVIGPEVTTVNELIAHYSSLRQGDKLQMISDLYTIFRKYTQTSENFDDFYFWGEVLLADFNDVDRYLVNAKDLYSNLANLKEIELLFDYLTPEQKEAISRFWGTIATGGKKSQQEKFLSIWKNLYAVYDEFRKQLKNKGMAYSGMIYRDVAGRFRENPPGLKFSKYYIIGLNALNTCEKVFFEVLKQKQKAVFLWDYDWFYLEDEHNHAGRFIRENLRHFPPPDDFQLNDSGFAKDKNIKLAAVSSRYGQAQAIPQFLNEISSDVVEEFDNTAVVLADESLLYPALGAIPREFGTINVTMGYPVKNSVVYGFMLLLINLLKNRRTNGDGRAVAYHRYVTDVLNHQMISQLEPELTRQFMEQLRKNNLIAVPLGLVNFTELHRIIFSLPENVKDYSRYFLIVLGGFYDLVKKAEPGNQLLAELIYSLYQSVEKLENMISGVQKEQGTEISEAVYFRLFNQYIGQVSVAFEGEPLRGMQVMGILETRCLDFKNLVILGLNENNWPRASTAPSFIPYNLRKGFGLPGIDEQDAMYAYYFYRLVQRAKNITATYSTVKEGISTGELSRYGYQLRYDSGLKVENLTLDFRFSNEPLPLVSVSGSVENLALLLERNSAKNPLSPSAINTWLQCRLRFYFRYILKLPEPDEVKDEIDSPVFGSIFHEVIENLYKPFEGKTVNKSDLEIIRKDKVLIENEIRKAIGKYYLKQPDSDRKPVQLEGKTILFFENIKTFLERLIEIDMQLVPFQLIALEEKYSAPLIILINGIEHTVYTGGKIDRIDKVNGVFRIIDYKTGNVDSFSFNEVKELFERDKEPSKKEILQALIYCYIYNGNLNDDAEMQPAIYSLRKLFDDNFSPEIKRNKSSFVYRDVESEFIENLQLLVSEIFSPDNHFNQTLNEKNCRYCSFSKICRKY
jgi:CRISPR/Cas system-associated exonuclease Cas4 (RecB family)